MKISITLPSIYPKALARALDNIEASTRCDYEVLVVSPFEVEAPNVVWIEETSPMGCAHAHDVAARRATGDYLTAFADDFLYVDGWDLKVIPDFEDRSERWAGEYLMGLRYDFCDLVGTVFGIYYANFPFMRAGMLDRYGWIGPDYKIGFGDADLSMRAWHAGAMCEFSADKVLIVTPDDSRKGARLHSDADLQLFISRWYRQYGKGWRPHDLRDFNLDVVPEALGPRDYPRSVYMNYPGFRDLIIPPVVVTSAPMTIIDKGNGVYEARTAPDPNSPSLVETYAKHNIVAYGGQFYRVPQSLGSLDLANETDRQRPGIRHFDTIAQARRG